MANHYRRKLTLAIHECGLSTKGTVLEIKDAVSDMRDQAGATQTEKQRQEIRQWLSAPDPSTNHARASNSRQGTTGSWFLESEAFARWKAQRSFLWMNAKPGAGKTVLSSTIINQVRQEFSPMDNSALVYFYFDFNDHQKQNPENMIRSLILQVFDQCRVAFDKLRPLFSSCNDGGKHLDITGLVEVFKDIVHELDKTFIILDALDECPQSQELFKIIEQIHGCDSQDLHILTTSRNLTNVAEALDPLTNPEDRVSIDAALVNNDILAYVDERLQYDTGLKRWKSMPQVQTEIRGTLMKKADGMCVLFRVSVQRLSCSLTCPGSDGLHVSSTHYDLVPGSRYFEEP